MNHLPEVSKEQAIIYNYFPNTWQAVIWHKEYLERVNALRAKMAEQNVDFVYCEECLQVETSKR